MPIFRCKYTFRLFKDMAAAMQFIFNGTINVSKEGILTEFWALNYKTCHI